MDHLQVTQISKLFIIQTKKCTLYSYIYINNVLYIVSTATCFDASASQGVSSLYFVKLQKSLRL